MKKQAIVLIAVILGIFANQPHAAAVDAGDLDYTYGNIIRTTATTLTISRYDYDRDKDVEAEFEIDKETKINGASNLTEIPVDTWISVDYVNQGKKKIARIIEVDEMDWDDESAE